MKLLIPFFCLCLSSCDKAELESSHALVSNQDKPASNTIVVALEENVEWGHYQFIRNGQHVGLELDLLNHIDEHSAYVFEYKVIPWKRAMKEVREGTVDLLISATASPKRDAFYDYTDEIYQINQLLYFDKSRHPNGFQFEQQSEISAYQTGAILGYNTDELQFTVSHAGYRQLSVMAQAVEKEWIDFAIAYLELEKFNNHIPEQFDTVMIPDHPPLSCHWLTSNKNPRRKDILQELNKGIREIKASGRYEALESEYSQS
ncbi:substrate-binding periplasmic protein [Rubritalea profundi]|uniref:Solute-binding protein family 3/N-terminal domain-containing protein n=1 Tax=Rubritalea profundi TaxID=1658618 RepID=A0A2S7U3U3_9BACT|nr:transporter substrate-binding domain-containing protein [Rubritalea profundi]PQJ29101.1 hypothetical protein BSZ32_11760 [Rubritalea profundi]